MIALIVPIPAVWANLLDNVKYFICIPNYVRNKLYSVCPILPLQESQNKMSLQNVSIVLSPTMQISHRVLNVFFTYSKILFRDCVIKR